MCTLRNWLMLRAQLALFPSPPTPSTPFSRAGVCSAADDWVRAGADARYETLLSRPPLSGACSTFIGFEYPNRVEFRPGR